AELTERRAQHLPVTQQRGDIAPLEPDRLAAVLTAAARLDVIELSPVDRRALPWASIQHPPDDPERDAETADDEEQAPPPESLRDPEQRHAQESEADILS